MGPEFETARGMFLPIWLLNRENTPARERKRGLGIDGRRRGWVGLGGWGPGCVQGPLLRRYPGEGGVEGVEERQGPGQNPPPPP